MDRKLLLATRNKGKVRELQDLLADTGITVVDLSAFPDVRLLETETSFEGNARMKAGIAAQATGLWCLADDSGLEVDVLEGRPGVYSARFAGPEATDQQNNALLLEKMQGVPEASRTGRFVSAVALCSPAGECAVRRGECKGVILFEPHGTGGFGYDPLFYVPDEGGTFAEIPLERKNVLSHRARAFRAIRQDIIDRLGGN